MFLELVKDPPYRRWDKPSDLEARVGLPSLASELRASEEERAHMGGAGRWLEQWCEQHAGDRLEDVMARPAEEEGGTIKVDLHLTALFGRTPDEALAILERMPTERTCTRCSSRLIPALHLWLGDRAIAPLVRIARHWVLDVFPHTLSPWIVPSVLADLFDLYGDSKRARRYLRRFGPEIAPLLVALAAGADPSPLGMIAPEGVEEGDPVVSLEWRAGLALSMLARMGHEDAVAAAGKELGLESVARRWIAMPTILAGRDPDAPKLPDPIRLEGKTLDEGERASLLGLLARIDWRHARRDAEILRAELDDASRKAIVHAFTTAWSRSWWLPDRWVAQAAVALGPEHAEEIVTMAQRQKKTKMQRKFEESCVAVMADCAIFHPRLREAMFAAIGSLALDTAKTREHLHHAATEALVDLAIELGLNPDTLDDRTIPSLGFEASGKKVLDWGGRPVEVRMTPGLELVFEVDGEKKASPPSPRKGDDKKRIALAKKEVETLRKEGRVLARGLTGRIERWYRDRQRWNLDDFVRDVVGHPLLRAIAQGFVWGCFDDGPFSGRLLGTFRVAEDGSFANENDDPTRPSGQIGVVHPGEIDAATRQRWAERLADYEILPIVPQLELRTLTDDQKLSDRIDYPSPHGNGWHVKEVPPGWTGFWAGNYEGANSAFERELGRFRVTAFFTGTPRLYMRVRPIDRREQVWLRWGDVDDYTAHEALVDLDVMGDATAKAR